MRASTILRFLDMEDYRIGDAGRRLQDEHEASREAPTDDGPEIDVVTGHRIIRHAANEPPPEPRVPNRGRPFPSPQD